MVMERSRRSRRRPRLHLSETSSQYGGRKKERSPSPPPEMLLPYLKWGAKRGDEEVGGLAVAPGGALMPEGGQRGAGKERGIQAPVVAAQGGDAPPSPRGG